MHKLLVCLTVVAFASFSSCKSDSSYILSKNTKKSEIINILGDHIKLKSPIIEAHYSLYDVNLNTRSIPGPTDKDYKIYIKVDPDDITKWIPYDKITSFPRNSEWAKEIIPAETYNRVISNALIFASESNESTLEYFVNMQTGEILIHYVQH